MNAQMKPLSPHEQEAIIAESRRADERVLREMKPPLVDDSRSHLNNALAILELVDARHDSDADIATAIEGAKDRITAALALIERQLDPYEAILSSLERAHRSGVDIGDLLGAACREAARRVRDDLTVHRPGSWESEHVRALSQGWDWDEHPVADATGNEPRCGADDWAVTR